MSGELIIDPRGTKELRRRFAQLAASFTPDWNFSAEDPDAGSVLALIFLDQMNENIGRLNQLFDKYHTEFANLLSVSLLPASPATGVVVASLSADTVPGVPLWRGTRLLAQTEDSPVLFETTGDIYVTSAALTDILEISPRHGRILALRGGPEPIDIVGDPVPANPDENGEMPPEERAEEGPFTVFDFEEEGIEKNVFCLFHRSVLRVGGAVDLLVRPILPDGTSAAALLGDKSRFEWLTSSEEEFSPLEAREEDGCIRLHSEEAGKARTVDGAEYFTICARSRGSVTEALTLSDVRVAAVCTESAPEFVLHGETDAEVREFMPFGETAALYDECYIGADQIFSRPGATVKLRFKLVKRDKLVTMTPEQEEAELKVIKRKPHAVLFDTVTTSPERVTAEYFNGIGWRRLPELTKWETLFDGDHTGDQELTFICPEDWTALTVGSYNARALRLRILRADNCYLQPCIHTMPVIQELSLSCAYVNASVPNMRFPLAAENICSAEVWVSELPRFTPGSMEKLAKEQPDRVRISHDILGNITAFFVRWDEVENFDDSQAGDRHYVIDRLTRAIVFGDGVHVSIPPAQRGVAFTVREVSCAGRAGDLPAGAVDTLYDETFFVGSVENPVATSGGSDLETIDGAAKRASAVVSGHGRLVSERDYYTKRQTDEGAEITFDSKKFGFGPAGADSVLVCCCTEEALTARELGPVYGYEEQTIALPWPEGTVAASVQVLAELPPDGEDEAPAYRLVAPDGKDEEELCYSISETDGTLLIRHPAYGDAYRLLLAACVTTNGAQGNVRAGARLTRFGGYDGTDILKTYSAPSTGFGGESGESPEELRQRFAHEMRGTHTAVTAEDYEKLVLTAPGLCIHKVKAVAVPQENLVRVVVKPQGKKPCAPLPPLYRHQLEALLDEKRMLTSRVELVEPRYVRVDVQARLTVRPHFEHAREQIETLLREKLDQVTTNVPFGSWIRFGEIYDALSALPCVVSVESLHLTPEERAEISYSSMDFRMSDRALCTPGDISVELNVFAGARR